MERKRAERRRNHVCRVFKGEERGHMFGDLMVLGYFDTVARSGKTHRRVCVVCLCGNLCIRKKSELQRSCKNTKHVSCGCRILSRYLYFKGCGHVTGELYGQIKHKAKTRGIQFDVSVDYLERVASAQEYKCALTGIELRFKDARGCARTASLDRIDSNEGYVEGNVQWVHKKLNIMKHAIKQKDFIELCTLVAVRAGTVRHLND